MNAIMKGLALAALTMTVATSAAFATTGTLTEVRSGGTHTINKGWHTYECASSAGGNFTCSHNYSLRKSGAFVNSVRDLYYFCNNGSSHYRPSNVTYSGGGGQVAASLGDGNAVEKKLTLRGSNIFKSQGGDINVSC